MSTTSIVFLVLLIVVTVFTVCVLISDFVRGRKESESEPQTVAADEPEAAATQDEAVQEEAPPAVVVPTHEDKYNALSDDARGWYDEIAGYAAAVEGAQSKVGKSGEQYAVGNKKIVRLSIKNDVVVCSFTLRNSNFFAHEGESRIMISTASITTKITDQEHVSAAKSTIDMVMQSINDEKELKQKLASERRKQKKAQNEKREADAK